MKKSELIKIIKEEIQNVVKEQTIDGPTVMANWMSPDPLSDPETLQQRVMNTGLDALIGIKAWMESPEGEGYLVKDDGRVRAIKGAIESAIQFKQKPANKGEE